MNDKFQDKFRELPDTLVWWPLFLGFGIAVFFGLPYDPQWWMGFIGLISCGFLYIGIGKRFPVPILMLLIFIIGFMSAQWRTHLVAHTPWAHGDKAVSIVGTIADVTVMPYGVRYMIEDGYVEKHDEHLKRVRLVCRACDLSTTYVGDKIGFRASLMKPAGRARDGGFDFQRTAYFREISAVGFIYGTPETIESSGIKKDHFSAARQAMSTYINDEIKNEDTRALALALLTGVSSSLPNDLRNAYQSSGLAHIYSVSGLHLTFVAGFLFFLFRAGLALFPSIALTYPIKKIAALMAIIAVTLFTLFAGDAVPTWRALFMTSIVLLAVMIDRSAFTLRTVALVAVIILLVRPELLLSISFQLSFAAVTVLVAWMEWVQKPISKLERTRTRTGFMTRHAKIIRDVMVTSLLATLATLAFIIGSFGRLSIYAVVANMVGVPLTGFIIMPLVLVALIASLIGGAWLALPILSYPLDWLNKWAYIVDDWPYADIRVPVVGTEVITVCAIALYLLCVHPRKWTIGLLVGSYLVLAFVAWKPATLPQVYVSEKGLIGFVEQDILWVNSKTKDKFVRTQWLGEQGLDDYAVKTLPREGRVGGIGHCDRNMCLINKDVVLVRRPSAIASLCVQKNISIIIAPDYYIKQSACSGKQVIDKRALKNDGHMTINGTAIHHIKTNARRVWSQ